MKFVDGLMIHSGNPVNDYIQQAVRHVQLRQGKLQRISSSYFHFMELFFGEFPFSDVSFSGVVGVKVKIMLPYDPSGQSGTKMPLPDQVSFYLSPAEAGIVEWSIEVSFILRSVPKS